MGIPHWIGALAVLALIGGFVIFAFQQGMVVKPRRSTSKQMVGGLTGRDVDHEFGRLGQVPRAFSSHEFPFRLSAFFQGVERNGNSTR
jgi:hypothetical protein